MYVYYRQNIHALLKYLVFNEKNIKFIADEFAFWRDFNIKKTFNVKLESPTIRNRAIFKIYEKIKHFVNVENNLRNTFSLNCNGGSITCTKSWLYLLYMLELYSSA